MHLKTKLIVNPHAAGGSVGRQWPELEALFKEVLSNFTADFTERPLHATELTRNALEQGNELIVSVGGDGTNNEIINGFFKDKAPINPDALFFPFTAGTGGDFVKTLNHSKAYKDKLYYLSRANSKPIDVGYITFVNHDNQPESRYFLNITSLGIGGEVDYRVNHASKMFGGFVSFLKATVISILTYKGKQVSYRIDDGQWEQSKIFLIAAANGRFFGGGMQIAPNAVIDDGFFDVVVIGQQELHNMLMFFPKVYSGSHLELANVAVYKSRKVEVVSDDVVLIDMDGEQPGKLPITFELLPGALKLIY